MRIKKLKEDIYNGKTKNITTITPKLFLSLIIFTEKIFNSYLN